MASLSMEKDPSKKDPDAIQRGSGANRQEPIESKEWKPTVRMKKRDESPRQKLRIKDLSPDKQYVKDVIDNELKYFLLLSIPVVLTAIIALMARGDIYNRFVAFIVKLFSNS
ncbi:MAG TPA: hypothetical protein PKG52_10695 [bacterium]|nr:hypothetical protein [bacterium]HPS31002.1 hypothetical protein [bacterium]